MFIQSDVAGSTCIVPNAPMHETMADCQPLSCSAIALIRLVGRVTCETVQKRLAAAASRAAPTCSRGAFVPSRCDVQVAGSLGGGGGTGTGLGTGFGVGFGLGFGLVDLLGETDG